MPTISIFSEEWRECLRAHYTYVLRTNDKITERTLRGVMIEAGFTDAELKELYILATAHVDDVGADFVPDMNIIQSEPEAIVVPAVAVPLSSPPAQQQEGVNVVMPQEAIEAAQVEESLSLDEGATTAEIDEADMDERELEEDEGEDAEPPPKSDPDVTQLSLF